VNITAKRFWVMFSVALNIGFVIVAVVLLYKHLPPFRDHAKMSQEIIYRLDLPADVEKSVIASMEKMETAHRNFVWRLHQARNETITLLSRPEPVDKKRFEMLNDGIIELMIQENHVIREHLIEIRSQMGDEKGARFFSEMLKQVEKRGLKEPS
jgi:hypothetical protein